MSSLDERNKSAKSGGNPGLTPVDDIHSGSRTAEDIEPDGTTGRTPALERTKIPKSKNRNSSGGGGRFREKARRK